jgi:hypothetical protein
VKARAQGAGISAKTFNGKFVTLGYRLDRQDNDDDGEQHKDEKEDNACVNHGCDYPLLDAAPTDLASATMLIIRDDLSNRYHALSLSYADLLGVGMAAFVAGPNGDGPVIFLEDGR